MCWRSKARTKFVNSSQGLNGTLLMKFAKVAAKQKIILQKKNFILLDYLVK